MAYKFGEVVQGLLGNLNEVPIAALMQEYGAYLMTGEIIRAGFKLVRDVLIITDRRILSFDKQGATGHKMCAETIYLSSICNVMVETAGFGLDDSELGIEYIVTPYHKAPNVEIGFKKYEFPKKYNIQGLYRLLQEIAYQNYTQLNG